MSIKRTIITTIVALALVAVVAPGVAQGVTVDELLALIAQLQGQLATLQGGTTPSGTGACAGVTFTRNLTVGSTGTDVKCLQVLLNNNGFVLATTGAGSPGMETSYFGPRTLAVIRAFQVSKGWTPANQVGPLTRAALNALLGSTPGNPVVVPTGAGLSVMVSSDNPTAGTLVSGTNIYTAPSQGGADLAHFTFVNGDNAAVKVTNFKVTRTGVAADATLANVYLYNGAQRLTDAASVSSGLITFNDPTGLFTVPAGSSVTISVLADLALSASGQTVGVKVNASTDVTTNASSVKGYFPVSGNVHNIASATLANVDFAGSAPTPASGDVDPQNDYVVWQNTLTVGTRAVKFSRLALYQTGSASATDIQNYRLVVDGTTVGSAVASANAQGYITFDLSSSPVTLQTGSRVVKVLADIIGGSSKTFAYAVRVSADAVFTDSQINVGTIPTYGSGTAFTQRKSCATTACSINSGAVTFTKRTDSPAGNIVLGASGVTLAKYDVKAAGEPVKINDLYVYVYESAAVTYLANGSLFANGVQIGNTASIMTNTTGTTGTHFALGSSLIVNPGSPVVLEVRADIKEVSGTAVANGQTMYAVVVTTASNAEAQNSKSSVTTPAANVNGNSLTVSQGGLTLSKYTAYTSQSAVLPVTAYKLAHYTLTANTTEAVNVSTIEVGLNYVSGNTNNLYVKMGNNTTPVKATVALSNTWSVNYQIAAGTTVDVMVYGDVNTNAAGVAVAGMYVAGTTANSAVAVIQGTTPQTGSDTIAGQTITWASGALTTAVDGSTPDSQVVAGGQSVVAGKFKFTASNDSYTIKELKFTVKGDAATSAVITSLTVKDGATPLATVPYDAVNTRFYVTGLSVPVAANTTKVLTAEYNLSTPYTDSASNVTTGLDAQLTMDTAKVANSQGTESDKDDNRDANYLYAFKTVPTFTNVQITGQGANLVSGSTIELMKFTVKADEKGPVALKQLIFDTNITDGGTESAPAINTLTLFRGSTNISTSVLIQDSGATTLEGTTTSLDELNSTNVYVVFNTEEVIPAGTIYTYTLKGVPSGFMGVSGDTDSVTTSLLADAAPSGGSVGDNTTEKWLASVGQAETAIQLLKSTANGTTGTTNYVIWSDQSAQVHGYIVDTLANGASADWFNGYLLNSLPLSGNGINYNN